MPLVTFKRSGSSGPSIHAWIVLSRSHFSDGSFGLHNIMACPYLSECISLGTSTFDRAA